MTVRTLIDVVDVLPLSDIFKCDLRHENGTFFRQIRDESYNFQTNQ